jgi:hypothetical protein
LESKIVCVRERTVKREREREIVKLGTKERERELVWWRGGMEI